MPLKGIERLQETLNRYKMNVAAMIQEGDEDAEVDEDALRAAMAGQPKMLIKWGTLTARAERIRDDYKDNLENVKFSCQVQARKKLEAAGEKVTEARVEELAMLMPDYQKARLDYNDAAELYRYLYKIEKGIISRDKQIENINYRQGKEFDLYPRDAETAVAHRRSLEELQELRRQQLQARSES